MTDETPDVLLGVVEPADGDESASAAAHQAVHAALETVRDALKERRHDRDQANDTIRRLVDDEETLSQALGVFERRRKTDG
ncbi:MAG TPA: hypothetical protein VIX41_11510 [Acidimicrobiales bacterium]